MLQHDHHECACAKSVTFTYTILVFEVLKFMVAECMAEEHYLAIARVGTDPN